MSVLPPKCVQSADLLGKGNLEKERVKETFHKNGLSGTIHVRMLMPRSVLVEKTQTFSTDI